MNTKRMFLLGIVALLVVAFATGTALSSGAADITVVYEDDYMVVYQDGDFGNRIALNKAGGVDAYCPCEDVCPLTAQGAPATATQPPQTTATSQPPYNGVWIHHESQGVGDQSWTRCMPPSAWNGHSPHEGDWLGGGCYR